MAKTRLEGIVERRNTPTAGDVALISDLIEVCHKLSAFRKIVMWGDEIKDWAEEVDEVWDVLSKLLSDDGLEETTDGPID